MRSILLCLLPLAVLGARKRDIASTAFQLYAYSEEIGGFPLFYADGLAYVGSPTLFKGTDASVVTFTIDADKNFIGNPNATTAASKPTWSNAALFIPSSHSNDRRVGFLPSNHDAGNATIRTSGFAFYGSTAMLYGEDGSISTSFYGMKVENGVFQLHWNDTDGKVPLTLRNIAPSNVVSKLR
ncbi:hypothetical protein ACET3X_002306 [Alternaria dauci]|uniref:Uncharacterized protein n=1 Tax=Alternaria dauci TaxID=48095 RepID=A0ABR3UR35_9PLEO